MKKLIVKILFVFPMLLLCFAAFTSPTSATSTVQDGLAVTLVAEKPNYKAGDNIHITATIQNTNAFSVTNVNFEITLPDGLKLLSGEKNVTIANLSAGQTQTFSLVAISTNLPRTGDSSSIWLFLSGVSAGLIILLAVLKKKMPPKYLSVILCAALLTSAMTPVIGATVKMQTKNISVKETILVDGISYTISLTGTFDWSDAPDPPRTFILTAPADKTANGVTATVTFDKASPLAAGETVTATITLSGKTTKAGTFTIDLTSTKAGLSTDQKLKDAMSETNLTDTYDFVFNVPEQDVDDFALTFDFVASNPIVMTGDANEITSSGAIIVNNTFSNTAGTVLSVGIKYTTNFEDYVTVYGTIGASYTVALSNLTPSTTYYFFAVVDTTTDGTVEAATKSFTTASVPVPLVDAGAASAITSNSALISSNSYSNVTGTVLSVGIEYSRFGDFETYSTELGTIGSPFSVTLSGLYSGVTYYYRAVITTDNGTFRGEIKSLTTLYT